jgi:hypothetical protein
MSTYFLRARYPHLLIYTMSTAAPHPSEPPTILALRDVNDATTLTSILSTLFEPSPPLNSLLVRSVLLRLTAADPPISSYNKLVDICAEVAEGWTWEQKAEFLSGHPMIGEVKGLSALSGKEQGGATREVVLSRSAIFGGRFEVTKVYDSRLAHLNQLYCKIYPGLGYITFVNSRPRAAIIPELEGIIGLPISPEPLPDEFAVNQPSMDSGEVSSRVKDPQSQEWKDECTRGLGDVWRIARARLKGMNLD